MANIPTPRSRSQILNDMLQAFLSKTGLTRVIVGSPVLSAFEAAAQSDLRSSHDIFQMLAASSLDRAEGQGLDRIGKDEGLLRITESPASGTITISDSSFTKIASKVYQGVPAPIAGSDKVFVLDAQSFPASGQIYIGRGTTNYEGPLTYTSKAQVGTYWQLNLSGATKTTKFHNFNETVVLAQGGNRLVNAGIIAQTAQGNVSDAVKFSVLYAAVIADGETSVTGVTVIAQKPGPVSNAPAGHINSFVSPPFTGATVTNPLPFTNAQATEDDKTFRERIRNVRQSRAKGISLAIKTSVLGVTATDENKRIVSASMIARKGLPSTLYIDDGTGYEERTSGIAQETLTESAFGGEEHFQASATRPVAKAYSATSLTAPFALKAGMVLAVKVGGFLSKHTFDADEFRSISNATAFEIAASINANSPLLFAARTILNGTAVAIFAKADENEDIEVVEADSDELDSNPFLGFSAGRTDTMRLYKNDRLLSKDGQKAIITSEPQNVWAAMSSPQTLTIAIDGTPATTYTFTDLDFVNSKTGYGTLAASNALSAWAKVFNSKIPGITVTAVGGKLTFVSNIGPSARAEINITGGTLVSGAKMFVFNTASGLVSTGKARDYTLDRNTGQLRLESALVAGDRLAIGSKNTRAFVESTRITPVTLASDAELWFVVDGDATVVETGVVASTAISIADYTMTPAASWGLRVRISAVSGAPFVNIKEGDWAILLDRGLDASNRGAWRIAYVDPFAAYFEIERSGIVYDTNVSMSHGGIVFVRANAPVQLVTVPAASNYTASTFVDAINEGIEGATAEVYQTSRFRVRTNTFDTSGDIALVAQNTEAAKLGLTITDAVANLTGHLASVQSTNSEVGTPGFHLHSVDAVFALDSFACLDDLDISNQVVFLRSRPDVDLGVSRSRFGTNFGYRSAIATDDGSETFTFRRLALDEFIPEDQFYMASPFALGASDDLTVVIDGDVSQKRYSMNLFRKVKAASSTYGATNSFSDVDNSNNSLALGFGTDFDFRDFAVLTKARAKSHAEAGDTTKTILWRYERFGLDGLRVKVAYAYPTAASQTVAVTADPAVSGSSSDILVSVRLPSDVARTGQTIRNTTKIGVIAATTGSLQTLTYILGYAISSAVRNVKLNYTARGTTAFSGAVTGGTSGATGTVVTDSLAGGSSGAGILTLSAVSGTFLAGEALTGTAGAATSSGGQTGETTLTLNVAAPGATNHGFIASNQIWIQSTDGNFTSGLKTLTSVTATTITYAESNNSVPSAANIGTASFDSQGEAKLTGSTIVVGDIANFLAGTALPPSYVRQVRLNAVGAQHVKGLAPTAATTTTVPSWYEVVSASNITFYPLNAATNTASAIAGAVNALPSSPVSAVAVGAAGVATGTISLASFEEFTTPSYSYRLRDGVNFIQSHSVPPDTTTNFSFTFKLPISATLATNSDWQNEDVRLVPVTAKNVAAFMNTLAVSGLASSAEVSLCSDFSRVEIASLTTGAEGSVQVQGGSANAASASVLGSARVLGQYMIVNTKKADMNSLSAGMWVGIQNSSPMPKGVFGSTTRCVSINTSGNVVLDTTQAWAYANVGAAPIDGFTWQVEKHGRYTAFRWDGIGTAPDLRSVLEGDWVIVSKNARTISSRNTGQFRIVRISDTEYTFWIENANMAPEIVTADLKFLTYDSIMPGDTITISTSLWGDNMGTWTVESLGATTYEFKLSTSSRSTIAFSGPVALGSEASLVQCVEGTASKLVKQIYSINTNASDPTMVDVKFNTAEGHTNVGAVAGSLLIALDKLAFPTTLAAGIDGYEHNIGLIGEAARILYGDERDPATYPGVVAAGGNVNISGPLVKRIQVALAVRTASSRNFEVIDRVKSAVAAAINSAGVGESIAISKLIEAAGKVNGVFAITFISPVYGEGNDIIPVQPFEKPLVLDLDQDIQVSIVGV